MNHEEYVANDHLDSNQSYTQLGTKLHFLYIQWDTPDTSDHRITSDWNNYRFGWQEDPWSNLSQSIPSYHVLNDNPITISHQIHTVLCFYWPTTASLGQKNSLTYYDSSLVWRKHYLIYESDMILWAHSQRSSNQKACRNRRRYIHPIKFLIYLLITFGCLSLVWNSLLLFGIGSSRGRRGRWGLGGWSIGHLCYMMLFLQFHIVIYLEQQTNVWTT